ncbi:MAG: hypothetical protein OHK0024_24830 [Thalassobaculales bacterium]
MHQVAVIVPLYRPGPFLDRALAAVARQRLPPAELVLVDDASGDGSAEAAARAIAGLAAARLLALPENRGPAGARNAGAALATAPLLAFLDQDDEWHPDYLARQAATLAARPAAVLAHADLVVSDGRRRQTLGRDLPEDADALRRLFLLERNPLPTLSMVMVRRTAFQAAGGFDDSLRITHDRRLYLALARLGPFARTPGLLAAKHQHASNLTRERGLESWREDSLRFVERALADPANADLLPLAGEARRQVDRRIRAAAG